MKQFVKTFITSWLCFFFGISSSAFGEIVVTTAIRYDTGYDNQSPETIGYEITVPLGVAYKRKQFSLSVETAYSSATVEADSETNYRLSGFTDILLSASYTYTFSNRPMALMLGLDVNIPTGQEQLSKEEALAEWGESNDLFEVDNFGEGFNAGLSLGLMRQFGKAVFALQGAYIFNGEFDPSSDVPDDKLDPGDQILALGLLEWQTAPWCKFNTFVSYSYFLTDKTEGEGHFRQGQQVVVGGNIRLNSDPAELAVSLQSTISGKSEVLTEDTLQKEPESSNGTDIFGMATLFYHFSDRFNVRLQGDIRYYGESDLKDEHTGLLFSGKRVRYAAGPGFDLRLNKRLSCTGLFKFFTMDQDRDAFLEHDVNFKGWNLDLAFSYVL